MKVSIGNDHGGYGLTMFLIKHLQKQNVDIFYYGSFSDEESVDYPDYAERVSQDVASSRSKFGILVCRSGVGMCMAANKMHNIRAANCWSAEIARLAREHNDANVLCLGADFVDECNAREIVDIFLDTGFSHRHRKRVGKIKALENLCNNGKFNYRVC
ncbi:MAG: RpiB/LacA/LacB family sugar-phosphate isomerase [Puniceicoccales bacterium]|jgi:ribose 5-phosphate isomerase B|nr:RpiB/LacA/LacB family sugar-phosphate isomerase [Puniceicoccales bacterium]